MTSDSGEMAPMSGAPLLGNSSSTRLPPIATMLQGGSSFDSSATPDFSSPLPFVNFRNPNPFNQSMRDEIIPSTSGFHVLPPEPTLPAGKSDSSKTKSLHPLTVPAQQFNVSTTGLNFPKESSANLSPGTIYRQRTASSSSLVSPTGGPLHPLPSGLVGYPPLSPPMKFVRTASTSAIRETEPGPTNFRPRSNSLSSGQGYPLGFHSRTNLIESDSMGARRGSLSDFRSNSSSGPNRSPTLGHSYENSSPGQRIRRRQLDPYTQTRLGQNMPAISHSRTESHSSAEENRSAAAWAPRDQHRGSIATTQGSTSSSHSSPRNAADLGTISATTSPVLPQNSINFNNPSAGGKENPNLAGLQINSPAWSQRNNSIISQTQPADFAAWQRNSSNAATNNLTASGSFPVVPSSRAAAPTSTTEDADLGTEFGRYGCPHCAKRFARPSSLRTHIHSHTGEKPFSCDLCGRGFSVQSNLRRHLKIHRSNAAGGVGGNDVTMEDGDEMMSSTEELSPVDEIDATRTNLIANLPA